MEREGGKFRTFLLRLLDNFLANHWDRSRARKRGAGQALLSLDADQGETRYALEPPDHTTPETLYERQWVLTLLANVLGNLGRECEGMGKGRLFTDLRPHLQGDQLGLTYAEVAAKIGRPRAVRAVGGACGANPVAVIVPCHRVLASAGKLGGFTGGEGAPTKRALLAHEAHAWGHAP